MYCSCPACDRVKIESLEKFPRGILCLVFITVKTNSLALLKTSKGQSLHSQLLVPTSTRGPASRSPVRATVQLTGGKPVSVRNETRFDEKWTPAPTVLSPGGLRLCWAGSGAPIAFLLNGRAAASSWLAGGVSWLASSVSWLVGGVSWLASSVSWLVGGVSWLASSVSWLAGSVSWLARAISWLALLAHHHVGLVGNHRVHHLQKKGPYLLSF